MPTTPTDAQRYTVRTVIPDQLKRRFFVAWINDANHPDDPKEGASISWHLGLDDAYRVCDALNQAERIARADRIAQTFRNHFPEMANPTPEIADTGKVRLGDGFISAEFPPLTAKVA